VSVRIHSLFSATIAVATVGLCQSSVAIAEPFKTLGSQHLSNPRAAGISDWKVTPVVLAHAAKGDRAKVASAMSRLDLSKLTMADFGDVEQPR
jgi:hypothetical protein